MRKKITLSKSHRYLFNHFLRTYKQAIQSLQLREYLSSAEILSILDYLGYVDQFHSEKDRELANTIAHLLSESRNGWVTQGNLFRFLMVVGNVQGDERTYFDQEARELPEERRANITGKPLVLLQIGSFQAGRWLCSEPEKKSIRELFLSMNHKRISRTECEARRKMNRSCLQEEQTTFMPKTLAKSKVLAETHLKKLHIDLQTPVENRLMISRSLNHSRLEKERSTSKKKEMQYCTFKPKTNNRRRQFSKENSFIGNQSMEKQLTVEDKLLRQGREYESRRNQLQTNRLLLNKSLQERQCSFKPRVNRCVPRHSQPFPIAKNQGKQIARLKLGRENRQLANAVKRREYPANISWNKFVNSLRNSRQSFQNNSICSQQQSSNLPILCIDLKILNEKHNINVFEGQDIKVLCGQICRNNGIPKQSWCKVEQLIFQQINQCHDVVLAGERVYVRQR